MCLIIAPELFPGILYSSIPSSLPHDYPGRFILGRAFHAPPPVSSSPGDLSMQHPPGTRKQSTVPRLSGNPLGHAWPSLDYFNGSLIISVTQKGRVSPKGLSLMIGRTCPTSDGLLTGKLTLS